MDILKKYISNKSNNKQIKPKTLPNYQNEKPNFINDGNEALYFQNKMLFDRLEKFLELERLTDNYKMKS